MIAVTGFALGAAVGAGAGLVQRRKKWVAFSAILVLAIGGAMALVLAGQVPTVWGVLFASGWGAGCILTTTSKQAKPTSQPQ